LPKDAKLKTTSPFVKTTEDKYRKLKNVHLALVKFAENRTLVSRLKVKAESPKPKVKIQNHRHEEI
jgi:hypothetical protein